MGARVCVKAMNSVNKDLKFTTESQEDFQQERLPTLDFEMWLDNKMEIGHSYYQKPMKTPYVLMERSAMSYHQKYQILSNEMCRRLSNIQIGAVEHPEVLNKIEQYIKEMKNSGYSKKQAREIICSGVRGWKSRINKRKREEIPLYRLAEETVEERLRKELTEKESWYKDKDTDEDESPRKKIKKNKIKSVIFIPHTRNSELANVLRENEEDLADITGNKIKIVEKAGNKLENILAGKDPWKGMDCKRKNCFICSTKALTGKDMNKDCTK